MKKRILYTLLSLPFIGLGQNEANIWHFGRNAGIDFNSGSAVPISNGALNTLEGCATICDNNGNLLFYTDGLNVWNSNHAIMPNGFGLLGDPSTSQSAIIVKQPGSSTIYYIFTVDSEGGVNGLRYSQVDISMQGGLGDVNLNKNIPIVDPTCEKVNAIKHQNNTDYWIITHLFDNSDAFHAYELTSTGLNMTPVISNVGSIVPNFIPPYSIGYLKSTIDGSRIVSARYTFNNLEVYDFDNSTGIISNSMTFTNFNGFGFFGGPYGVEFSPNGNLLYVAEVASPTNVVYQYDLLAGTPGAIDSSRIIIGTPAPQMSGALQLAPDGKIYHAQNQELSLSVINDPNVLGVGCNYVANSFSLVGDTSTFGLPNFSGSLLGTTNFLYSNTCFGDSTEFNISTFSNVDSVTWNFGDPNSGVFNTSSDTIPKHLFTDTGSFTVTLVLYLLGNSDTVINQVIIEPVPDIDLGNDTSLCSGAILSLDVTTNGATYLWQDGSTNSSYLVTQAGTYWVEVMKNGCYDSDTIVVTYVSPPLLNLGSNTTLCQGESLLLDATTTNATYLWQDGSTNPTFTITQMGTYWVEVTVNSCSISDTIVVSFSSPSHLDLGNDTSLCQGQSLSLDATTAGASYLWHDGSTNPTFNVTLPGTYWVEVTGACISTDTIIVLQAFTPIVNLGKDTTFCEGKTIILNVSNPGASYSWQDGSADASFLVNESGEYFVEVSNACGMTLDTINIESEKCEVVLIMANVISPNNDGENDLFVPIKVEGIKSANISIFNRWGQKIHESADIIIGWDGTTTSGSQAPSGTYYWVINYNDINDESSGIKGYLTLLR